MIRVWNSPELAKKLNLEHTSSPDEGEIVLTIQDGRMGFVQKRGFTFTASDFSKLRPLVASQPMAKALGRDKKLKVLDCTAGWGLDSALIAKSGFTVLAFEKNKILYEILKEELQHNTSLSLEFRHGDSFNYLRTVSENDRPDIVFIDPMFEAKAKSAKSEKSIQILQSLVEPSPLTEELLELAIEKSKSRVVVKQNKRAPAFKRRPSLTFEGQSTRFDVYL